jgi:hypothetical protein
MNAIALTETLLLVETIIIIIIIIIIVGMSALYEP